MSSATEKSFVHYIVRKTGNVNDSSPTTRSITNEGPLDDRDQGSPVRSQLKFHEEDEEQNRKRQDRVSSIPSAISYREDGAHASLSHDDNLLDKVKKCKSRSKGSHRQHRRTKSSPNSAALLSPLEAQFIQNDESKLPCKEDKSNRVPMKRLNQRTRALSYSQQQRDYGALKGISEDEVFDMAEVPSLSTRYPNNQAYHYSKSHVEPRLRQSEFIESARAYISQSNGSYNNSNDIMILSHLDDKEVDHNKEDEKPKGHRRQRSVEQFMEHVKGSEQGLTCHDSFFALLFFIHIVLVIWIGVRYGSEALIEKAFDLDTSTSPGPVTVHSENLLVVEGTDLTFTYKKVILMACICGISSMGLSLLAFFVMTVFSTCLIQVALCLAISLGFLWGTTGIILAPKNFVPISGIFALGLTVAYTFVVWDRIPLASTKLKVGLLALQGRMGIILFTFVAQILFLLWSIFFTYATIGVYDALKDLVIPSTKTGRSCCYVALILSYFWVFQVSKHIVQVAVAGVVKEWWFNLDELSTSSMWTKASIRSILRACIFSFGSVCLGSLLVGIMNTLRQIADCIRPKQELLPFCGHYCFMACQGCTLSATSVIGSIFNPWAFIYIGLYGYSFVEAGQKATVLFQKRGWENIVNDDLIPNILLMVSLLIGGTTGCFAVLLENTEGSNLTSMTNPSLTAFLIGFSIGTMLSSILFSIIKSSVDAVIVCFAGSPVELENNHKALSHELRLAWKNVWPGSVDFVYDSNVPINSLGSNPLYPIPGETYTAPISLFDGL